MDKNGLLINPNYAQSNGFAQWKIKMAKSMLNKSLLASKDIELF